MLMIKIICNMRMNLIYQTKYQDVCEPWVRLAIEVGLKSELNICYLYCLQPSLPLTRLLYLRNCDLLRRCSDVFHYSG